jgi:outer membrane protein assembly factor BamE (lipoprotein component of BamABCDE complex)
MRRMIGSGLAFMFLLCAAGCLVTSSSKTTQSGTSVSGVTLDQIRPGETREAWLLASAGEPTSRAKVDDHTSILRYDHVETRKSGGTIFLLFAGGSTKQKTTSVRFEVTDGVIQRYWTESMGS